MQAYQRVDTVVVGTKETFCRVCGFDDHLDERYLVGEPQYIFCDCCGSESGRMTCTRTWSAGPG